MSVRTDNRIVFYGDPHGNREPLIEAVARDDLAIASLDLLSGIGLVW